MYNCTCIYIDWVLAKYYICRHLCCRRVWVNVSEEKGFDTKHMWPLHLLSSRLCNILLESVPLVAVLVPPSSLMAAISKAFTMLPWKSDRSDAEVGESHQSHTLRLESVCSVEKLSAHDFPLKSPFTNGMARAHSIANSFLAFSTYMNRQFSCMDDGPCLLCLFVDTCVCFWDIGTFVCVVCACVCCVCVCVCLWWCTHSSLEQQEAGTGSIRGNWHFT